MKMSKKENTITAFFWKFSERLITQGVTFIVSLVLARLLVPEEYGIVAIILIFIAIANVFVQGGLNVALIQKKNPDSLDYSSVLAASLVMAFICYLIIFITAPIIETYFGYKNLSVATKLLGVTLFFGAINSLQIAYISVNMLFRKLLLSSFSASVISGTIGIYLAYKGFGVFALVWQNIINSIVVTTILFFTIKWKPKINFSFERFSKLFDFGWKILLSNLITTLFMNIQSIVIGKKYSADELGYFNRGKQFPWIIISNIDGTIQSVMLPVYSAHQDDTEKVRLLASKTLKNTMFIISPLMMILFIFSEDIILLLLTDKWLDSVFYLRLFSLIYLILPIHTINLQIIKATGHSKALISIEIIKKTLEIIALIVGLYYGVKTIAFGILVTSILSLPINSYPNRTIINYGMLSQLKDLARIAISTLVTFILANRISLLFEISYINLTIQISMTILIYTIITYLFNVDVIHHVTKILMKRLK